MNGYSGAFRIKCDLFSLIFPIIVLAFFLVILTSCKSATIESKCYVESEPTFYNLRNGNWLTSGWIRKPENLKVIHETFKKAGYSKLISSNLLFDSPLVIQDIYIGKKGCHLLDSLELSYGQIDTKEKYYREFWQRRRRENNDSIVYLIIKDINYAFKHKLSSAMLSLNVNDKFVNDTLADLLEIEFRTDSLTEQLAIQDFENLRRLGFHQSAYNLLYEKYKYKSIKWNRDSLVATLKRSDECFRPWFQDDTK